WSNGSPLVLARAVRLGPVFGRCGSKRRYLTGIQGNAGQGAETMRKNAEHNRDHNGQLDRFLPWYMCFLPKEDETEHDGSESARSEPPREQHGGGTQAGANDGDRHR